METKDFFNHGFGWTCRHCAAEFARCVADDAGNAQNPTRLFTEGENEGKAPALTNRAVARWADPEHRTLFCPRCGITELIDIG